MPFRILPASLCSELRFRRAYTRWKAYEIVHKILEKSWVFDQFFSVEVSKLHRRYQRFILSPTSLPFGILAITLYSELCFGRSCTCWKAYEILYKILKKSWAFEHCLSVGWTDDSVSSSGATHFCVNTSLYVSWKSIAWRQHIRWKPASPCKLWKLQSESHDVDPTGRSEEVGGEICKITFANHPSTSHEFCKSPLHLPWVLHWIKIVWLILKFS
jgi:hypothetical protein